VKVFVKIAFGGAAALALVITVAIGRSTLPVTGAPPAAAEAKTDERWANDFETAVLKKTDRFRQIDTTKTAVASPEPATVATERILPDAPGKMPPVVLVDREEKPAARAESNVCTKHKMHKVWVSKYSWRCRK
jgi:hypothetical protein